MPENKKKLSKFQKKIHEVIFEADTAHGRAFDLVLIVSIVMSVGVVMLDSVASIRETWGNWLYAAEWFFTILFSIEYLLRIYSIGNPFLYMKSFFGIIDFLAILPTYLSLMFPAGRYFMIIRILRVLRIFRVLKLVQYVSEAKLLIAALKTSRTKITVFVFTVLTLVVVFGSVMYLVEGAENGFTSIPRSIYWAIVTLTTVGYGDISPNTSMGQFIAAIIMIFGYAIIAVPTGIVTAEMIEAGKKQVSTQACSHCASEGHDYDAQHCKFCGSKL